MFAPELLTTNYGKEIWTLYEAGNLHPDSKLTGIIEQDSTITDLRELMMVIDHAKEEEAERLERLAAAE
jgi:RIO kinase 1